MLKFLIFFISFWYCSYAQTVPINKPIVCSEPPEGYSLGGKLESFELTCVASGNSSDLVMIKISNARDSNMGFSLLNPKVIVNPQDSLELDLAVGLPLKNDAMDLKLPIGGHWLALVGEFQGKKFLTCRFVESIFINKPVVTNNICITNKVTFDIPKVEQNNFDFYRIIWGNGQEEFKDISLSPLPLKIENTFGSKVDEVRIQGLHRRQNLNVCQSQIVKVIDNSESLDPVLTNLISKTEDKSVEIRYNTVLKDKIVDVLSIKGPNLNLEDWQVVGRGTNGQLKVLDLDIDQNYCFHLKSTNTCGNVVLSKAVLCTINLKVEPTAIDVMNVSWIVPSLMKVTNPKVVLEKSVFGCPECPVDSINLLPNHTNVIFPNLQWDKAYSFKLKYKINETIIDGKYMYSGVESFRITKDFSSQITANGIELRDNFTVFPNPTSQFIGLKINKKLSNELKIELVDNSGRIKVINDWRVDFTNSNKEETSIYFDSVDLVSGLYIVRLTDDNLVYSNKVYIK